MECWLISHAQTSRLPCLWPHFTLHFFMFLPPYAVLYLLSFKICFITPLHTPILFLFTSYSLVDLCNFGGVDYKPSENSLSENGEDLPSTRSASLSSDISAFSSVTLLSTDELDRLLDDVRGLGDDTLQVKQVT